MIKGITPKRILIACEFSGIVRDAFTANGHDAWSCDLLPTDRPGNHYQGDVIPHLTDGWDLMIAHPPCQYLSYAGMRHWNNPGRKEKRDSAMAFFMELWNAPIQKVCLENPKGLPCKVFGLPTQTIHPFAFGHSERKRTCLWLRGLPKLHATNLTEPAAAQSIDKTTGHNRFFVESTRDWKLRSTTFQGVADAMAEQWGNLI